MNDNFSISKNIGKYFGIVNNVVNVVISNINYNAFESETNLNEYIETIIRTLKTYMYFIKNEAGCPLDLENLNRYIAVKLIEYCKFDKYEDDIASDITSIFNIFNLEKPFPLSLKKQLSEMSELEQKAVVDFISTNGFISSLQYIKYIFNLYSFNKNDDDNVPLRHIKDDRDFVLNDLSSVIDLVKTLELKIKKLEEKIS